jgi:plastocyanin
MIRPDLWALGLLCVAMTACSGGEPQPSVSQTPAQQPPAVMTDGYEVVPVTDGGAIAGTIFVSGPIPTLVTRPISKDPHVCGRGARRSQELIVNKTGGLKNAIVMVEGIRRGKAMPAAHAQIDQTGCEYVPHVQAMPVNGELSITNSDPVLHNIHFYRGDEDLFNIAQPLKGQTNRQRIEKAGFMYVECDVHGWMKGHIAVVDNPYYAITDENGAFSIRDLPAGTHTVKIWHEYLGEETRSVTVPSKGDVSLDVDLKAFLAKKQPMDAGSPRLQQGQRPRGGGADVLSGDVTVNMIADGGTFKFEPAHLTVKAGASVKWVNGSDNRHSATDDPKFEKTPGMAILPVNAESWSTPFIANGQEASHTFTTPGKYQYFCRNHGQFGMVATITVVR